MGRRQFINKKNAATFQLVHRSQRDPEIHNEDASQRVFVPVSGPAAREKVPDRKTIQTRHELEKDFHGTVRPNEGEAAEYGVYFDDTSYDYMQHLKPTGNIGAVMLETRAAIKTGKSSKPAFQLPDEVKPTPVENPANYQNQQSVQDSISGFQPDLDERIREVLEALENEEAAPEEDSEDWFQELTKDGVADEIDFSKGRGWEDTEEDDGWQSDETTKPDRPSAHRRPDQSEWEREFSKFKKAGAGAIEEDGSVAESAFTAASTGRIKHGNGSIGTGFSMSSSALWRTEGLTLLDDRFDKVEREYDIAEEDEDDEEEEEMQRAQGQSPKIQSVRDDFEAIMDEFLVQHKNMGQKGTQKRSRNPYTLDDARIALGNTHISR